MLCGTASGDFGFVFVVTACVMRDSQEGSQLVVDGVASYQAVDPAGEQDAELARIKAQIGCDLATVRCMKQAFDKADSNGDGVIEEVELAGILTERYGFSPEEVGQAFRVQPPHHHALGEV